MIVVVAGRIDAPDIPRLCARVCRILEGNDAEVVICDVARVVDPDACTVDALARMQLTARRLGGSIRLRHPSRELCELLALAGLRELLPRERR